MFTTGLISQRFSRSFVTSGVCDFSTDFIESIESVISCPSIRNYHIEGPPIFNPNQACSPVVPKTLL